MQILRRHLRQRPQIPVLPAVVYSATWEAVQLLSKSLAADCLATWEVQRHRNPRADRICSRALARAIQVVHNNKVARRQRVLEAVFLEVPSHLRRKRSLEVCSPAWAPIPAPPKAVLREAAYSAIRAIHLRHRLSRSRFLEALEARQLEGGFCKWLSSLITLELAELTEPA